MRLGRKRGRPRKFDRPSRLVAMTLPEDVIAALRELDRDIARAIVTLAKVGGKKQGTRPASPAGLVQVAPRRFLITVDPSAVKRLPGIQLVPFGSHGAFLALEPGRGLADLNLAVMDRLEDTGLDARERSALIAFRGALRKWRQDKKISYETRAIVIVRRP